MSLPTDPVPYAEFIVRHLMQHPVPGEPFRAVSETELPIEGDLWFWADDNAKILELFAIPQLWHRYPKESKDLLKFIEDLSFGPFILRRVGHARLDETHNDGTGNASFIHTFMYIGCELQRGIVNVGIRFHDGRTARNLTFAGQQLEFVHEGTRHHIEAGNFIDHHAITRSGNELILRHESIIDVPYGERKKRIGKLVYNFTFSDRTMFINADVNLILENGVTVSDVVLSFTHDELSHREHGENDVVYGEINTVSPGESSKTIAEEPRQLLIPAPQVSYWSIVQPNWIRGFALAIHSLSRTSEKFIGLRADVREEKMLHRVVSQYAFPGVSTGQVLRATEEKLLTSGGFYDEVKEYEAMLRHFCDEKHDSPIDFSISYDYGAELNAFARVFRALSASETDPELTALRSKSRELFDRYFDVYSRLLMDLQETDLSAIFARPLAFVIYGLIDMWYVTGEERYRTGLRRAVDFLLTFERRLVGEDGKPLSLFVIGHREQLVFVDCHSASLLALVRALPVLEDPKLITFIDQGLDAYRIETLGIPLGDLRKEDLVCLGRYPTDRLDDCHSYWNFTAGLTLRLFKVLRQSTHQATTEIFARHRNRIEILEAVLKARIELSLRDRDGALEIKTGRLSDEGNSETQPWVALGLVTDSGDLPPDHQFPTALARPTKREDVIAAYHLILGREPESEKAITDNLLNSDLGALRNQFLNADEFLQGMPRVTSHQGLPITALPLEVEVDVAPEVLTAMVRKTGEYWNKVGREAPHWSVVTASKFLPENIMQHQDEFFESSRIDEEIILSGLARVGVVPSELRSCVEFGCGVGRLTFRLASLFPKVTGIDISSSHLALAREYCNRLDQKNVDFVQASSEALMPAEGFDFWFSRIVLQHNPPPVSMAIIRKAFQALNRGGIAMFQVPVYHVGYSFRAHDYLSSRLGENMEMHCVPQQAILNLAQSHGLQLLDVREDTWVVSDGPDWLSNNFIFRRL
jgi:SAM-dependent methyltransferase